MTRTKMIRTPFLCLMLLTGTFSWAQSPSTGQDQRAQLFARTQKLLQSGKTSAALKTMKKYLALGGQPNINDLFNGFLVAKEAKSCFDMYLFSLGHDALAGASKRPREFVRPLKKCAGKLGTKYAIKITSNIKEADVFVNGIWLGMTPMGPSALPAGEYLIRVSHPDHKSYESNHRVTKRSAPDFRAYLNKKKSFGTLVIKTIPQGASITIEGKQMGKAPLGPLQLETGKHFVELKMEGYDKFIRNVKIRRNEENLFEATLESSKGSGGR